MTFGFGDNDPFNQPIKSGIDDAWLFASNNPSYQNILAALRSDESMSESCYYYAEKALKLVSLEMLEIVNLEKVALGNSNKFQFSQGWDGGYIRIVEMIKEKRLIKKAV